MEMADRIAEAAETAQHHIKRAASGREDVLGPMQVVRKLGITSDIAYSLGLGSVLVALVAWFLGKTERAHQRGIFMGLWAPTFMALGKALEGYEHIGR
jgi:hypothetical protein